MHSRHADSDPERVQLRREAAMLGLVRHPAVVEVVSADDDGARLVTRVDAQATLEHGPRPGSRGWLRALAGVAQTVADLHTLGVVHGGLRADRIWIDHRGRSLVDGFDRAGLAGQCVDGGPRLRPSADVSALAAIVAGGWPTEVDTAGSDRGGRNGQRPRGRNRSTGPGPELAAVLAAGEAGGWPPARRLAQALDAELARSTGATRTAGAETRGAPPAASPTASTHGAAAPAVASEPDPDPFAHLRPTDPPVRARRPRRPRRPSVLAVCLATVGVVALGWGASRVAARPSRPTLAALTVPVVSIAGTSYRIGQAGDQVQVGSWGCDRTRAVVLRPRTGEVFAFDGWARAGHDLTARVVAHVARGSRLVTSHQPDGCDGLAVTAPGRAGVDLDAAVTR